MTQDPQGRPVDETGRPSPALSPAEPHSAASGAHPVARAIGVRLAAAGWHVEDAAWPDRTVTVARQARWMWQSLFTKVHTAVVVVPLLGGENRAWLDAVQRHVRDVVSIQAGAGHGLVSSSAVVTVAVGGYLGEDVTGWARRAHGRQYGAFTHPVVVDVSTGAITHPGPAIVGAFLNGHFKRIVRDVVAPSVAPPSLG